MKQNGLKTKNRCKKERGKTRTRRTKHESHETHHKMNPRGHEVVRVTIPTANLEFLHKSLNLWTSLLRTLRRAKTREGRGENERGKGDGGSLILFNRTITILVVPLDILSRTT
jgi:hypothetical protein